jgi:hypothetical protein
MVLWCDNLGRLQSSVTPSNTNLVLLWGYVKGVLKINNQLNSSRKICLGNLGEPHLISWKVERLVSLWKNSTCGHTFFQDASSGLSFLSDEFWLFLDSHSSLGNTNSLQSLYVCIMSVCLSSLSYWFCVHGLYLNQYIEFHDNWLVLWMIFL